MLRYKVSGTNRIIGRVQTRIGGDNKYIKAIHYGTEFGSNRGVHFHQFTRGALTAVGDNIGGIRTFRCRPAGLGSYSEVFGSLGTDIDLTSIRNANGSTYQTDFMTSQSDDRTKFVINGDEVDRILVSVDGGAFWNELTWVAGSTKLYRKGGGLGGSAGWPDLSAGDPPASASFTAVIAYAP